MLTASEAKSIAVIEEVKPSPPDEALMLAVTLNEDAILAVKVVESVLESVEWAAKLKERSLLSCWPVNHYCDLYNKLPKIRKQRVKDMVIKKLTDLGHTATIKTIPAKKGIINRVMVDIKETTSLEVTW